MYSEEIEKVLSAAKIKAGDSVKLTSPKGTFEGVLMPRPEVGDSSIIVIKRKDGYNMGVRYGKGVSIKKTVEGRQSFSFPEGKFKRKEGLPEIALLYTGGTIGSKVDYVSGGVYMLTKPEELLYEVPELHDIANIKVTNLMSIASEDMTCAEWKRIAAAVADAFTSGARGVIITHGTDTMHYTAAALSFMLKDLNGPVVLTGAQRSGDRGSSDAFLNLVCAANLAAKSDIAEVGICMHNNSSDMSCAMIRGTKARKMHTSRRDAFRPINNEPIAVVQADGRIDYKSAYKKVGKEGRRSVLANNFEEKTAMVKFYPNSDPDIIDYYLKKGYRGMIIEGTGLGHVAVTPSKKEISWISHIKEAVGKGMVIGMTSQCLYGRVNPTVYRNLRMASVAGAVYCEDMTPETAYVKLGFLLGNYSIEKARSMLNVNLAGEITKITAYEETVE